MNFKKLFSKNFAEYLARSIHHRTGKYLNELKEKENQAKDSLWLNNFKETDFFDHWLEKGIKIRLYEDSILSRLIYDGFEKEEISFLKKAIKKGDYFLDIGANIGLFSLYAAKIVGDQGKVISFEPSPKTYERLVENMQLNGYTNVMCINQGLSDKQDTLELKVSENGFDAWDSFANLASGRVQKTISVPVITLNHFFKIENLPLGKVAFVKIDVEGWEKFVIQGGREFFEEYSPTIMVEFTESNTFQAGYTVHDLYDLLLNMGYTWHRFINNELVPEEKQLHYPYDNLVATKDIKRLKNAILI